MSVTSQGSSWEWTPYCSKCAVYTDTIWLIQNSTSSYTHKHTQSHTGRRRRHLHQNRFWSAGGLSCRKLSNKGSNKARTRCSLSKATGSGCTPEEAMPSADLCQWSRHMQQIPYWNLLVQILRPKIFRKNKNLREITREQSFLQLKGKKLTWRISPISQLQQCEISKGKPASPFLIQNLFV